MKENQQTCSLQLDRDGKTPICRVHGEPLQKLDVNEVVGMPGRPDTTRWMCPKSGEAFIHNDNFPGIESA